MLASITILLGLQLFDWPKGLCFLAGALVLMQTAGYAWLTRVSRRIGTYQAIWGPDQTRPGNRN